MRGTPVPSSVYLTSLVAVGLLSGIASVVIMVVLGVAEFGVHLYPRLLPAAIVTLLVGGLCLCALGLAVSLVRRERGNGAGGRQHHAAAARLHLGRVRVVHGAPQWLSTLASVFPLRHMVDAFSASFSPHTSGSGFRPGDLAVMLAWALAGARVAVRRFRWEPAQGGSAGRHRQPHVSAAPR